MSCSTTTNPCAYHFLECTKDCFVYQHVKEATHHRHGQNANILDLIFTNEECMINDLRLTAPLGKSHHSGILFKFTGYTEQNNNFIRKHFSTKATTKDLASISTVSTGLPTSMISHVMTGGKSSAKDSPKPSKN